MRACVRACVYTRVCACIRVCVRVFVPALLALIGRQPYFKDIYFKVAIMDGPEKSS